MRGKLASIMSSHPWCDGVTVRRPPVQSPALPANPSGHRDRDGRHHLPPALRLLPSQGNPAAAAMGGEDLGAITPKGGGRRAGLWPFHSQVGKLRPERERTSLQPQNPTWSFSPHLQKAAPVALGRHSALALSFSAGKGQRLHPPKGPPHTLSTQSAPRECCACPLEAPSRLTFLP